MSRPAHDPPDAGSDARTEPGAAGLASPPEGWPLDHVGVAVPDLDAGAAPWTTLGLPRGEDETLESQGVRVRMLHAGDVHVELLAPLRDESTVGRFLASRGPGLHHLAFRVPDVAAELARLRDAGARLVDETPRSGRAGSRVAFLHPAWSGGVLVELVQPAAPPPGAPSPGGASAGDAPPRNPPPPDPPARGGR